MQINNTMLVVKLRKKDWGDRNPDKTDLRSTRVGPRPNERVFFFKVGLGLYHYVSILLVTRPSHRGRIKTHYVPISFLSSTVISSSLPWRESRLSSVSEASQLNQPSEVGTLDTRDREANKKEESGSRG